MIELNKRSKLVGEFIKKRREALGLSQRALGLSFDPAVTTQFISNVERGVTPLPPVHIPVLAKALSISDTEIVELLEREYMMKLSGRLGKPEDKDRGDSNATPSLVVAGPDYEFMKSLYTAYRNADAKTRDSFATVCESILKVTKK